MKLKVRSTFVEDDGNIPVYVLAEYLERKVFIELLRKGVIYKQTDNYSRRGYVWAVDEDAAKRNGITLEEI